MSERRPDSQPEQAPIDRLTSDLAVPGSLPGGTGAPEVVETHISRLFLTTHRVYKVKKRLALAFLDYSTLERRRTFCHEEVRLNRRLAPATYLGVAPLTLDAEGRWRLAGDGRAREWAVEMRRLPEAGMLDRRLAGGGIDNAMLDEVAELLARFHAAAAGGEEVRRFGAPPAVRELVEDNLRELEAFVGEPGPLPAPLHRFLGGRSAAFLVDSHDLLARRVEEGRIREGHGDLHAGNLCLTDAGWVVYDCIEFSRRFRCGDQALDLAFLAMDLDHRGFHAFSDYLVRRYARLADDPELPGLLPFYKAYRAGVRGKVACLRADGLSGRQRQAARREAAGYFQLAASYGLGPALVLTCGLPATGKSWAARALAARWGAAWLRSDVRRKSLAGVPLAASGTGERGDGELYSEEMTRRTYASLLRRAAEALDHGRGVIVDATFSRADQRASFLELARERDLPAYVLHLRASEEAVRERLEKRSHDPSDPSDADLSVYRRAREGFEEPAEIDRDALIESTTEGAAPEDVVASVTLRRIAAEAQA